MRVTSVRPVLVSTNVKFAATRPENSNEPKFTTVSNQNVVTSPATTTSPASSTRWPLAESSAASASRTIAGTGLAATMSAVLLPNPLRSYPIRSVSGRLSTSMATANVAGGITDNGPRAVFVGSRPTSSVDFVNAQPVTASTATARGAR